jgi:hypothetical protein
VAGDSHIARRGAGEGDATYAARDFPEQDGARVLTDPGERDSVTVGERYSFKIKYRFQVLVPKRQILPCAVMRFSAAL